MIRAVLFAFLAGAIFESACVCWVHFSERGLALYTALCSIVVGTAQVSGLNEALLSTHKGWASAAYALGLGTGAFATVYLKAKGWSF